MEKEEMELLLRQQKQYFYKGATLPVDARIRALRRLLEAVEKYEPLIYEALEKDLGKSRFESYMCEVGLVKSEIGYMIRHVRRFSSEKTVHTPLAQFASRSYVKPSPYGVCLIMSPWNYPFLLTIDPLADAIAAGNTAILKPSAYSPNTSTVIAQMIRSCFEPQCVTVITGGREENSALLDLPFDYIFFTGSINVGRLVMSRAAERLTPVTLELGGKSPCIVDSTAKLKLAARRIVFGKFLNCGQTCVAPDYLLCDERVEDRLLTEICNEIIRQFGQNPLNNEDYGKIVNEKHFQRLCSLMDPEKVVKGGQTDPDHLRIAPTVMDHVTFDDDIMGEEIFGPILPVLTYRSIDEVIERINSMSHPLALYIFTEDRRTARQITSRCGFGGGCINDTIIHLATSEMGFGGFGESGMGSYHGRAGFDNFSHKKNIVDKKTWMDHPMRYQPYRTINDKLIHMFIH